MWKLIDDDYISQELRAGHIVSENNGRGGSYQIREVRENGIVTAVKTDARDFMIIFPKKDLVDANWWVKG